MIKQIQSRISDYGSSEAILSAIFILFIYSLLSNLKTQFSYPHEFESWQISEWLINFQGGYVRRGLPGEVLYLLVQHFDINIRLVIKIFSLCCLTLLAGFFIRHFLQKGYKLYILPTCLFFATHFTNGMYWTKRDYLILLLLILALSSFLKIKHQLINGIVVNTLFICAIQVHEAVALFTLPVMHLIAYAYFNKGFPLKAFIGSFIYFLPSTLSFLLVAKYHGDLHIAQKIWDSWVVAIGCAPAEIDNWSHGVVSSIGWTREMAFEFHWNKNFWSESAGIVSLSFWILLIPVVYFISSNYLVVFGNNKSIFTNESRTILSAVLIVQLICILPFFLFLSCDLGRIIFYWMTSSFILFLKVPEAMLLNAFPKFFLNSVHALNQWMDSLMRPTKALMAVLLVILGIPTAGFSVEFIVQSSVVGNIMMLFSKLAN